MTVPDSERRHALLHDREHEAAERAHRREHEANDKAVDLAYQGLGRRLDELNQLRKEVVLDRSMFVNSESYAAESGSIKLELRTKLEGLNNRIDALEKILDRAEGAANTWRWLAGFLGIGGIGTVIWAIVQTGQP